MEYLEQDNGQRIEISDEIVSQGRDVVAAFCDAQRAAPATSRAVSPAAPAAPAAAFTAVPSRPAPGEE